MKAIEDKDGQLIWAETAAPMAMAGEVVIQIRATAINRADLLQRAGLYPVPPGASPILGLECSGEIAALGEGVAGFEIGDKVCALLVGGGYAEQVAVPAGQVLPLPKGLDFIQGAAIPEVFATAYLNLYRLAALTPGEKVLLHAGASGVGTAAIQLCKAFANPCFVTAGSTEKINSCIELGAQGGSNRNDESFVEVVAKWTDGSGVDVILDPVGGRYLEDNLKSLSLDGRLVLIGLMGGADAQVSLGLMLIKRLKVIGSTLRALSVERKAAVITELGQRVWPLFEDGTIRPIVEASLPISEVQKAHELVASNSTVGKVVLYMD
ncbi:MAG: NAD(P)H-quinone oxidoreductase [Pseudomonadales bacterium]